jgi:DNA-binding response OmpR family regulator
MNADILIVDDDRYLTQSLAKLLRGNGFEVRHAPDFSSGLRECEARQPDLLVLDLGLPDGDGITLCRRIRTRWNFPVLMLTSRGSAMDTVVGLEVGADDYLSKPFEAAELLARLRALLRRSREYQAAPSVPDRAEAGGVVVDLDARTVVVGGNEIEATETELRLLALLVKNCGRAVSRESLFEEVWGYSPDLGSNSLEVLVYRIRKKLEPYGSGNRLKTVRGFGYKFTAGE